MNRSILTLALLAALLTGCGTLRDMVTPQDQTAGTSNNRSAAVAGGGAATWSYQDGAAAGREGGENTMRVPLRDKDGKLQFDNDGKVVYLEIPGPVRDIYIAGTTQEFHAEVTQSGSSTADQSQDAETRGPAPTTTTSTDATVTPSQGAKVPALPPVPAPAPAPADGE